jgi:hypothetical protein
MKKRTVDIFEMIEVAMLGVFGLLGYLAIKLQSKTLNIVFAVVFFLLFLLILFQVHFANNDIRNKEFKDEN